MNELKNATSPYLLQHAKNPVEWREWGDSAFSEARERDVPIFLSVGYSSCHWCHVMAHESFEDDDVAALLNATFVNVKVDREERPDVDTVYMDAVTALTGHGGWPMSVFLDHELRPFFAGTYWPPRARSGMPGFVDVVAAVAEAWRQRRDEVDASAARIVSALEQATRTPAADTLDPGVVDDAAQAVLENAWDRRNGGFGRAPKFPQAMTIEWLLHRHDRTGDADALACAVQALDAMARGGIHDQLAGGFARYATDARWLVPHFEKMLVDNALLLPAYAAAASLTARADLRAIATSTAHWLLTDARRDDGLLIASMDADTDGREGAFYVWSYDEFVEVVREAGADPDLHAAAYGVTAAGNWKATNVLHRPVGLAEFARDNGLDPAAFEDESERVRAALLARRSKRTAPGIDDKALADANALAVRGLVVAGRLLDEPGWIDEAAAIAARLDETLVVDARLHHTHARGRVGPSAYLEDHACMALSEIELLCATGVSTHLDRALWHAEQAHARFEDPAGGWFKTAHDAPALVTRPKDTWDNATPAGTSVMVEVCLALADLTGDADWQLRAEQGLAAFQQQLARMPTGFGWTLRQLEGLASDRRQVAIVGAPGDERDQLERAVTHRPRSGVRAVVAPPEHGDAFALLRGRYGVEGRPAAYVCRDLVCELPVTDALQLLELLEPAG